MRQTLASLLLLHRARHKPSASQKSYGSVSPGLCQDESAMWPLPYLTVPGYSKTGLHLLCLTYGLSRSRRDFSSSLPTRGTWAACSISVSKSIPTGRSACPLHRSPRGNSCAIFIHSFLYTLGQLPATGVNGILPLQPTSLLHKMCKLIGKCSVHAHPKDPHFRLRQSGSVAWMIQGWWKSSEISFFYSEFILSNIIRVFLSPPHPPPCT